MADPVTTQTAPEVTQQTQQTAPSTPAPAPTPAAPAPAATAPASASVAGTGAAQSQAALSVVQALSQQYGLDLGVQDDHAALARLAQAYQYAQQNHHLVQYGQQYVQHADQFNAWRRQQEEAARQQQAAQQKQGWGWTAPEWDPSWQQKILRDQNGNLTVAQGQDPSIINKYLAWTDHQRGVLDRLAQDPLKVIQPGLEQLIDQRAQALFEQRFAATQEQSAARDFVRQNSSWLHQRDQSGNVLIDQRTGREALSPAGQRFGQYVQQAEQLGLNTQAQVQYAMGLTQRDVLYAQQSALQAQQQGAQQAQAAADPRQAFLAQAAANAQGNRAAQVQQGQQAQTNGAPPPITSQRELQQQMMADMMANGLLPHQQMF
jgi:hypothetical protein